MLFKNVIIQMSYADHLISFKLLLQEDFLRKLVKCPSTDGLNIG